MKLPEKATISEFINPTNATNELSAMAVVIFDGKILATTENIYGKATLSLPKGHKEDGEELVETAIRECFEETNVVISKNDLIKELTPFSYQFLTPSSQLICKTIAPFLFKVKNAGNPMPKEERMLAVQWMNVKEFLDKCTHSNVKSVVKSI